MPSVVIADFPNLRYKTYWGEQLNGDCSGRDWRESGRSDYDLFPSPTFISIAPLYRGLSTSVKQKKNKKTENVPRLIYGWRKWLCSGKLTRWAGLVYTTVHKLDVPGPCAQQEI